MLGTLLNSKSFYKFFNQRRLVSKDFFFCRCRIKPFGPVNFRHFYAFAGTRRPVNPN